MRGKYCMYCGNKLPQDGDFCPDCGEQVFIGQIDSRKGYFTHCRVRIPLDASFCPICGSEILVEEEEETLEEDASVSTNTDVDKGEGMFANVGVRIQNFSGFFFIINLVISIGLAYLTYEFGNTRGDGPILPAILVFFISFIIGWLFCLLLNGYGKMIEYQKRILEELLKKDK